MRPLKSLVNVLPAIFEGCRSRHKEGKGKAAIKKTTKSHLTHQCAWCNKRTSANVDPSYLQSPHSSPCLPARSSLPVSNNQEQKCLDERDAPSAPQNLRTQENDAILPGSTSSASQFHESVLRYSKEELNDRQGLRGSERCLVDLEKFSKEFPRERVQAFLNPIEQKLWDENPHMRQVFANRDTCKSRMKLMHREMIPEDRIINHETPRAKYARRRGEAKTVEHWGQRKLLLAEVEFLTEVSKPGDLVLYAGAAPGTHINYLAEFLFPELRWVLVDPAPFEAVQTEKVTIVNAYFTDEVADAYRGKATLFISDVRSLTDETDYALVESQVRADMAVQQSWTERVGARWSLLKFRLPYSSGTTPYFSGTCHFQPWCGRTSTETRLWVAAADAEPKAKKHLYDHESYGDICFYHNTVTRTAHFEHADVRIPGIDHCYDCTAELFILERYLQKRGIVTSTTTKEEIAKQLEELSKEISASISTSGRKGFFLFDQ